MNHQMTSTTFDISGYRVVKNLGVVRGITVRSRSIFGTFLEICEKSREEAFELMLHHAQVHGANGVIGVRYDATELTKEVTEVLCYGTAVVVEPSTQV